MNWYLEVDLSRLRNEALSFERLTLDYLFPKYILLMLLPSLLKVLLLQYSHLTSLDHLLTELVFHLVVVLFLRLFGGRVHDLFIFLHTTPQ